MLSQDFRFTKRHIGLILLLAGGAAFLGLLAVDAVFRAPDRVNTIGPAQLLALVVSGLAALVGASLIPLGAGSAAERPEPRPVELPVSWARAGQILLGLALLAMVGYLLIYIVYAVSLMQFPFDYDQGEGFELVDTVMFSRFQWPYQNTETFPFYSSNYPPLFHVIAAPFVWIFGPQYWYGRLLGFLGTLITAGAIGYAVYREEKHRPTAVISGLAYLASNYVYHVGPLFRQHLFMVMFEALAIVALSNVHRIEDQRQRRRVMLAGIIFLLAAGYTKQLALATAVAAFVYLFLYNPRRSLVWGVMFSAAAGAIFLWINLGTGGQWWLNIIAANVNPFVDGQFEGLLRQWWGLHGALIIPAALLVLYELYFDDISIYSVWFVAAVANTLLAGKWGAGDSYFATAIAAMSILSGIFAARTLRGGWHFPQNYLTRPLAGLRAFAQRRRKALLAAASVLVPAGYLLYAAAVFHIPTGGPIFGPLTDALGIEPNTQFELYDSAGWTVGYAVLGQLPTAEDHENGWRLTEIVAEGDAPAISEDAAFSILAGKEVVTNPTQLKNLYENGLYDPASLVTMIEDQAFSVIILRALFYPDPVLFAMGQAYYDAESIPMNGFDYHVFRPDSTWPARRALRDAIYALEAGDDVAHVIEVPLEDAQAWVTSLFAQVEWTQAGEWGGSAALFERDGVQAAVSIEVVEDDLLRVSVSAGG